MVSLRRMASKRDRGLGRHSDRRRRLARPKEERPNERATRLTLTEPLLRRRVVGAAPCAWRAPLTDSTVVPQVSTDNRCRGKGLYFRAAPFERQAPSHSGLLGDCAPRDSTTLPRLAGARSH